MYFRDGVIIIREAPLIRSSFPPDRLLTFDPSDEVWGKYPEISTPPLFLFGKIIRRREK